MRGDHTYHRDVYDLVRLWTCESNADDGRMDESEHKYDDGNDLNGNGQGGDMNNSVEDMILPVWDEGHPMLRPICPGSLVEIARICNPF